MKIFFHNFKKVIFSVPFIAAVLITNISAAINYRLNLDTAFAGTGGLNTFLFTTVFSFTVFIYTAPVIGSLAFSLYFGDEVSSGNIKQVMMMTSAKKYTISRLMMAFVYGALAVLIGLSINLLIAVIIDPSPAYRIRDVLTTGAFSFIYDTSMLGYVLVIMLNFAVFCGLYSLLSAGIMMITKNKYIAVTAPTVFYLLSNLSFGGAVIFAIPILPKSTLVIDTISYFSLFKDHIIVLLIGVALFLIGMRRWRVAAE